MSLGKMVFNVGWSFDLVRVAQYGTICLKHTFHAKIISRTGTRFCLVPGCSCDHSDFGKSCTIRVSRRRLKLRLVV